MTIWFCVVAYTDFYESFLAFLVGGDFWEVGGLGGVRPMALKTVRRSRQSPRIAPSIEASRCLSSWLSSVWRLVRGGVLSLVAFLPYSSRGLGEFPDADAPRLAALGSFDSRSLAQDDFSGQAGRRG
jgi:hypothetical protein